MKIQGPAIVLSFFLAAPLVAQDLVRLAKEVQPSVVALKVYDRFDNPEGLGTGFFVGDEGWIVTNHHVIENGYRIVAVLAGDKQVQVTRVVAEDDDEDLAILEVAERPAVRGLRLGNSDEVEVGQEIVVLGNPQGLSGTFTDGLVSAIRDEIPDFHPRPVLQISAPISSGSSGSPVITLRGDVVGVAVSQAVHGQNLNFAVPSATLERLLQRVRDGSAGSGRELGQGAGVVGKIAGSVVVRNLVISMLFFVGLYYGFRRLR